jgi:hypothetical protein
MMRVLFIACMQVLYFHFLQAQVPYWLFIDSGYSLQEAQILIQDRMQYDAVYHPGTELKIRTTSQWLHAVSVDLHPHDIEYFSSVPYVQKLEVFHGAFVALNQSRENTIVSPRYGYGITQLDAQAFHLKNLSGNGVDIGVLDAGFMGLDKMPIRSNVKLYKNYVEVEADSIYSWDSNQNDNHGTYVVLLIGGASEYGPIGMATDSKYALAKTDHPILESRIDEDNWVSALEWLDSLGIKLVNSSLGYVDGFDDASENHKPEHMNGKHTAITLAAQKATEEKGMLIVNAAGNEGANAGWRVLGAPSDAEGVLTVGAIDKKGRRAAFSSLGTPGLPYVKPEVVAYSENGTSFSAPLITGFAACLWQYKPDLSNVQIKDIICRSGALYPYGNNWVGYGLPNATRAMQIADGDTLQLSDWKVLESPEGKVRIRLQQKQKDKAQVFHKLDSIVVSQFEFVSVRGKKCRLTRPEGVSRSTILLRPGKGYEIFWL